MAELKPFSSAPEAQALVLSTECTHVAPGLPELTGGVRVYIPLSSLEAALALKGVILIEPSPNPDFTL